MVAFFVGFAAVLLDVRYAPVLVLAVTVLGVLLFPITGVVLFPITGVVLFPIFGVLLLVEVSDFILLGGGPSTSCQLYLSEINDRQ